MHQSILGEILQQRVASSRGMSKRRGVKRNQTKYPVIRKRDRPERIDYEKCFQILK